MSSDISSKQNQSPFTVFVGRLAVVVSIQILSYLRFAALTPLIFVYMIMVVLFFTSLSGVYWDWSLKPIFDVILFFPRPVLEFFLGKEALYAAVVDSDMIWNALLRAFVRFSLLLYILDNVSAPLRRFSRTSPSDYPSLLRQRVKRHFLLIGIAYGIIAVHMALRTNSIFGILGINAFFAFMTMVCALVLLSVTGIIDAIIRTLKDAYQKEAFHTTSTVK